jgi:hypothetical protein
MAPPRSGNPALVAKIEAILRGPTWQATYRFLFLVAMRFTKRNDAEAEELVAKAVAKIAGDLDDVAKDVFLALVVRGDYDRNALAEKHGCDVDAARRRAAARTKAVVDADPDSDDEPVSSGPAPVPAKPAPRHDSDEQDE